MDFEHRGLIDQLATLPEYLEGQIRPIFTGLDVHLQFMGMGWNEDEEVLITQWSIESNVTGYELDMAIRSDAIAAIMCGIFDSEEPNLYRDIITALKNAGFEVVEEEYEYMLD